MSIVEIITPTLRNTAPVKSNLIGRARDKYKLVNNIMTSKLSRLVTLTGMPGVGKSALA